MPTFSYLAYADEHYTFQNPASPVEHNVVDFMSDADHYALDAELLSFYDFHRDGSGNGYVSLLRPLTNMRPTYRMPLVRAPHQFPADLHLIDWLSEKDFTFDVVTDHDVDESGVASLHDYRVVLTGSHPEYWMQAMWVAMQDYLGQGGRAMYLGGNGMYWVVSRDPLGRTWSNYAGTHGHGTVAVPAWRRVLGVHRRTGRPVATARVDAPSAFRRRDDRGRL